MTTPSEKTKLTEKQLQEGMDWIRSRPATLHDLMVQFPPSCTVEAVIPLHVPGPGKIGQLVSYVENKTNGEHTVRVRELPDGDIAAECKPEWLKVVGYWEHVTPEFVKLVLGK